MEKSVSMMEEFNRQEKITRQQKKDLIKELKSSTKLSSKSSSLTRTRTQPSHLDTSYYSCDEYRATDTPSPPPYPAIPASPSQPSPPDANMKKILSSGLDSFISFVIFIFINVSGHYYSFDKDTTYEPVMNIPQSHTCDNIMMHHHHHQNSMDNMMQHHHQSNMDNIETSAELLNIERSLYELSQRQEQAADGGSINVRNSFLSVDSGKIVVTELSICNLTFE